jgi:hypothetical protein
MMSLKEYAVTVKVFVAATQPEIAGKAVEAMLADTPATYAIDSVRPVLR